MESVAGLSCQDLGFGVLCRRASVGQNRTSLRIHVDIMGGMLGATGDMNDAVHSLRGSEW